MIKVLQFMDTMNRGGRETLLLDVCQAARRHELEMVVVTTKGGSMEEEFRQQSIEVCVEPRHGPFDLGLARRLKRLVKAHGAQIIHCHQPVEAAHSVLAALGKQTVMTWHGHLPSRTQWAAARLLSCRVAANVFVSHTFMEDAGYSSGRRSCVIHNGVRAERVCDRAGTLRKELGLSSDAQVYGMVSNFVPGKDHMTVCRALPDLLAGNRGMSFVFVGKRWPQYGRIHDECVEYCESKNLLDRVHFVGHRQDVGSVLADLDVLVMSTVHDTFGLVVAEAMLAGVPVIASDVPAMREVLQNGRLGRLFECGNPAALGHLLQLGVTDEARDMTMEAAAAARENYSIDAHLRKLRALYEVVRKGTE